MAQGTPPRLCSVDGCDKKHEGQGFCSGHRQRWAKGVPLDGPWLRRRAVCEVEGCGRKHLANGLCNAHYQQAQAGKQLHPVTPHHVGVSLEERLRRRIDTSDPTGCWPFRGSRSPRGYGRISVATGVPRQAHRVAYETWVGPIPPGLTIDHLCRNTSCCNPAHMEPVTRSENTRRMTAALANGRA